MTDQTVQFVLEFFATYGDKLTDDHWKIFHRWFHRVEMEKCREDWADYED